MTRGFFITGTDTGVGKTYLSAALARYARGIGRTVFAFKPIETGCRRVGDDWIGEDQILLREAAGSWQHGPLAGVYRFREPVAPLVAATIEGERIDIVRVVATARDGSARADLTLVEGAGGWRVPMTEHACMSDLARELGFPVVVVARATLGTINHTALTVEAVEHDDCKLAAIVMSQRPDDDATLAASNVEQIERLTGCRPIVLRDDIQSLSVLSPHWRS